jgi:hypothetical protein
VCRSAQNGLTPAVNGLTADAFASGLGRFWHQHRKNPQDPELNKVDREKQTVRVEDSSLPGRQAYF